MGIAVKDLLTEEFFKEFYVVAGKNGLNKEIQGITVMDAPDAFRWTKGKELVMATGYVISKEPDCIVRAFREGGIKAASAMFVKRERFLEEIPQEMLDLFDEYAIPLVTMPFSVAYMDVMSEVNTMVMNRAIRRFRMPYGNGGNFSNYTYREQKIRQILRAVEQEMKFPAYLYDIEQEMGFYSSASFKNISDRYGLGEMEYWAPTRKHSKHTLCDDIQMYRFRLTEDLPKDAPRVSWILIPISTNGIIQAYFVVMESRELLDNFDEYSIRIAYLVLQSVYEQIMIAQNMNDIGFENYILFALNHQDNDPAKLSYQANVHGISLGESYVYAMFRQVNPEVYARNWRKEVNNCFQSCRTSRSDKLVFLDENEGMLFLSITGKDKEETKEKTWNVLQLFSRKITELMPEMHFQFGVSLEGKKLKDIVKEIRKCKNALDRGKVIFPKEEIWDYDSLGPLAWLSIPQDELDDMLSVFRELMKDEKNMELLRTLKVYLESNLNYSLTAEKLFVHINTIRKRIDKISTMIDVDWEEPVSRLQLELLLQYLEL